MVERLQGTDQSLISKENVVSFNSEQSQASSHYKWRNRFDTIYAFEENGKEKRERERE